MKPARSLPGEAPAPRGLASDDADGLAARVRAWISDDPDPVSRRELEQLLANGRTEALAERFGSELRFGTAGLRGRLGAGPARMNRATVRQATAGFATYLREHVEGAAQAGVVIGHDARRGSAELAEETARVMAGAGLRAIRLPGTVPTPLLAFAVRHLDAAGGVMVTASHNPPQDNGYKVYLGDGAQIAPPVDTEISARIAAVGSLRDVALSDEVEWVDGAAIEDAYLRAIVAALPVTAESSPELTVVYTPLHGVGKDLLLAAFARAGLPQPHVVAAQAEPDGDFPTVERPNPEEPGTLDLALAQARAQRADLLLANDPDADRLAVAIPAGPEDWRVLTGDEVGALLARHLIVHSETPEEHVLVTTIASSTLLGRMAQEAGIAYRRTLTGFKWMMRAAAEARPRRLLLAYEEALGYAAGDVVHDKDGISAALLACRAAIEARQAGGDFAAQLDDLARRFGLHATRQVSIELDVAGGASEMMRRLRDRPVARLGGRPVDEIEDLLEHAHPSDVLVLRAGGDCRAVVRPSGTEPKVKIYLEVVLAVAPQEDIGAVRAQAAGRLDALEAELRHHLAP